MNIETTAPLHPCEMIYEAAGRPATYGDVEGVCRITGKRSIGQPFGKWVKKTFSDYSDLHEGEIISNAAAFCFCEVDQTLADLIGASKPQNFRTYTHIIDAEGVWHCYTKADKAKIVDRMLEGAQLVSITSTGQKHLLFKNRIGFWQYDNLHVPVDIPAFRRMHSRMMELLADGYNQREIATGEYKYPTIVKIGLETHLRNAEELAAWRGAPLFELAAALMYSTK